MAPGSFLQKAESEKLKSGVVNTIFYKVIPLTLPSKYIHNPNIYHHSHCYPSSGPLRLSPPLLWRLSGCVPASVLVCRGHDRNTTGSGVLLKTSARRHHPFSPNPPVAPRVDLSRDIQGLKGSYLPFSLWLHLLSLFSLLCSSHIELLITPAFDKHLPALGFSHWLFPLSGTFFC